MFEVRKLVLGTAIGSMSGLVVSILLSLLATLLPGEQRGLNLATRALVLLVPFGVASGALIGAATASLRDVLIPRELIAICMLLSLAMASLIIMSGEFAARSRMPIAIYGLAILNGIIVRPLIMLALQATRRTKERDIIV